MIPASFHNNNYSFNNGRHSPSHRQSSATRFSSSRLASTISNSTLAETTWKYKGANKHHWAKLQSKVKQRLMSENISYIEDEEEMARRTIPPPAAVFIAPPAFLETAQDKEERQRSQKMLDEDRKKKEDKFEDYQDDFAKDFPKGIAAHYAYLSESIITDLERAILNILPPTTNVRIHYRTMKDRLLYKFGPNSQKEAEEIRKQL